MDPVPVPISEKIILIQIQCVTADASTFKTRTARIGWKPSEWRVVTLRFRTTGENDIHGKWRTTSKREGGKSLEGSRVKYRYNLKNTKRMFKFLQIIELQQCWFYLTLWKGWICIFLQLVILQQNMNLQHMILTRKVSFIHYKKNIW